MKLLEEGSLTVDVGEHLNAYGAHLLAPLQLFARCIDILIRQRCHVIETAGIFLRCILKIVVASLGPVNTDIPLKGLRPRKRDGQKLYVEACRVQVAYSGFEIIMA